MLFPEPKQRIVTEAVSKCNHSMLVTIADPADLSDVSKFGRLQHMHDYPRPGYPTAKSYILVVNPVYNFDEVHKFLNDLNEYLVAPLFYQKDQDKVELRATDDTPPTVTASKGRNDWYRAIKDQKENRLAPGWIIYREVPLIHTRLCSPIFNASSGTPLRRDLLKELYGEMNIQDTFYEMYDAKELMADESALSVTNWVTKTISTITMIPAIHPEDQKGRAK